MFAQDTQTALNIFTVYQDTVVAYNKEQTVVLTQCIMDTISFLLNCFIQPLHILHQ